MAKVNTSKAKLAKSSNDLSIKMDNAHALVKALSSDNFNPSYVDNWFKDQRKATLKYAKALVAG